MASSPLDTVDWAILYQLQQDGRRAITDIADAVNVSDNTVRKRMRDMEDEGVISGYSVNLNYDRAGIEHYYLFVCSAPVSKREGYAEEIRDLADVVEVITLMTGNHNLYVLGAGEHKDGMTDLAYRIDELGVVIEREHLIRDHYEAPFAGFKPPGEP